MTTTTSTTIPRILTDSITTEAYIAEDPGEEWKSIERDRALNARLM